MSLALSPSGRRVAYGYTSVSVLSAGGQVLWMIPQATSPAWLDEDTVLVTRNRGLPGDEPLEAVTMTTRREWFAAGVVPPVAVGGGLAAGYRTDPPRVLVFNSEGAVVAEHPGLIDPAISENGLVVARRHSDGVLVRAASGQPISSAPTLNPRFGSNTLAYEAFLSGPRAVLVHTTPDQAPIRCPLAEPCFKPVPVWTGREIVVLLHTEDRVLLWRIGAEIGGLAYGDVLWAGDGGSAYVHDAKALSPSMVRVVALWQGQLREAIVNLDAAARPLVRSAPVPVPSPVPAPAPPAPAPPPPVPPKDPAPMNAPNRFDVVQRVHAENPGLIRSPHDFTNAVAYELWRENPRWGHNIKRGNQGLSEDAIAYLEPASRAGGVCIVDIIAGANGANPRPTWIDQTDATIAKGEIGAWARPKPYKAEPTPAPAPAPSPAPAPAPGLSPELAKQLERLELAFVGMAEAMVHVGTALESNREILRALSDRLDASDARREALANQQLEATMARKIETVKELTDVFANTRVRVRF